MMGVPPPGSGSRPADGAESTFVSTADATSIPNAFGEAAVPNGTPRSESRSTSPLAYRAAEVCPLSCFDCGAAYGDPSWIEAVVPHRIWNDHLSPTGNEGGILCIVCMARRAGRAGLSGVPVTLTAGPFIASAIEARSGETRSGSTEGESAAPVGGDAQTSPAKSRGEQG
jgi:hypothetical protein